MDESRRWVGGDDPLSSQPFEEDLEVYPLNLLVAQSFDRQKRPDITVKPPGPGKFSVLLPGSETGKRRGPVHPLPLTGAPLANP